VIKTVLKDLEMFQKLMGCVILGAVGELPECCIAARAYLARFAEVRIEDCDNPECDHPKLPPRFADGVAMGTPVGLLIADIERYANRGEEQEVYPPI